MTQAAERLARNARITLEVSCAVQPGETVLICARQRHTKYPCGEKLAVYAQALAAAAVEIGAHPVILDITSFLSSRAYAEGKVLEPIRAAMRAADVVVNTMDDVHYNRLLGLEDNDDSFLSAGLRRVFIQSNGMEEWHLTADEVAATERRTRRLMDLLAEADTVRVTSPAGTDFTYRMGPGANYTPVLGIVPLYGEVATAPRQGSESGLVVVDGPTQMGVRTRNELDREPLRIEVADGRVRDFSGEAEQVARLRAFIASGDPPADAIDEVGIPTSRVMENDRYWWSDGTHHLKCVHIALGNNAQRDSHVHGARHMDGEVQRPTVTIDGRVVLKDGEFTDDFMNA